VTVTYIWTKFSTQHKYRTVNTLKWPNSHKLKIQDGVGRHLKFWKNVILQQMIWEDASWPCGDDHVTKSRNRKLLFAWRHQMNVWSIRASISVTITDIWTKFGIEHKCYAIKTPAWPNSHELKIQDGSGRHLKFWKNVNNFGLDKDILQQIIWEDAPRPCGDDHWAKVETGS